MDKKNITKIIHSNTSVMDNNIIESPLFISSKREIATVGDLENCESISSSVNKVLSVIKEDFKKSPNPIGCENIPVVYKSWEDSKGVQRELLITHSIPDLTTMNVWNGLIGLYIQKLSPIHFNTTNNTYDIDSDTMEFTLYELSNFMKMSTGGKNLEILMREIIRLSNANYYSFANGVIFDKKNDKFLKSKTKSFSLIVDCEFDSEKRVKGEKVKTKCRIQFNRLIIDNIRYEYIKYIDPKEYFSLPSKGFTRRLYSYLKGNSFLSNGQKCRYIKRSLEVLRNKLSIYESQPSKIKERLLSPLKNLKSSGIISDFFFGDEIIINGTKEKCVYIVFIGENKDIISELNKKIEEVTKVLKNTKKELYIPKDVKSKLKELEVSEDFINKITKEKDKWEIIKYILWAEEEVEKRNIKNMGGLLRYALSSNQINLEARHKHILEYVEEHKRKTNAKSKKAILDVNVEYEKYLEKEIVKIKQEDIETYSLIEQSTLDNLNLSFEEKIKHLELTMNSSLIKSDEDKNKLNELKNEWLEFKEKQIESKLYKTRLFRELTLCFELLDFESFKADRYKKVD